MSDANFTTNSELFFIVDVNNVSRWPSYISQISHVHCSVCSRIILYTVHACDTVQFPLNNTTKLPIDGNYVHKPAARSKSTNTLRYGIIVSAASLSGTRIRLGLA